MSSFDPQQTKAQLLRLIRELSYEKRLVTLASGRQSDFYIDMRQTLLNVHGIDWVSGLMAYQLQSWDGRLKGCGGMTMGADPISTGLSLATRQWKHPLHAFYIRKEPKGHGTSQWIEGLKNFHPGDSVFVLEDVVTSGGSSLKAAEKAKDWGFKVEGIFTCVDREEGGREKIEGAGLKFLTLFTKSEIAND